MRFLMQNIRKIYTGTGQMDLGYKFHGKIGVDMKKIKDSIVSSATPAIQPELDALGIKLECLMDDAIGNGNFSMFSGLFSLENNSQSELESKIRQAANSVIQELRAKLEREAFFNTIVEDSETPVGPMDFYGME